MCDKTENVNLMDINSMWQKNLLLGKWQVGEQGLIITADSLHTFTRAISIQTLLPFQVTLIKRKKKVKLIWYDFQVKL